MIEQHPVPRNITGFQFQLIGSMTVKQFAYLAGGLVLALIFFKSPLSFLRYPLAAFFAFLGFAFAFLPIQERPLDVWLWNFLKSIYSPTQFIWQKENELPLFLRESFLPQKKVKTQTTPQTAQQHQEARQKLSAYLKTLKPAEPQILEEKEKERLNQLSSLLRGKITPPQSQASQPPQPPSPPPPRPTHIAGLVKAGEVVLPGVLIHIKDEGGKLVRLLKSDSEGKFASGLPLKSGIYSVEIEDPQKKYHFDKFRFRVNGQVIKPWLILAKNESSP